MKWKDSGFDPRTRSKVSWDSIVSTMNRENEEVRFELLIPRILRGTSVSYRVPLDFSPCPSQVRRSFACRAFLVFLER